MLSEVDKIKIKDKILKMEIQNQKQNHSKIIALSILLSIFIGGISGIVFSYLFIEGSVFFDPFFKKNRTLEKAEQRTIQVEENQVEENSRVISVVEEVNPSVVSIIVSKEVEKFYHFFEPNLSPFDKFFESPFEFFSPEEKKEKQQIGAGSGFIISSEGLILTNRHVASDKQAEYTVFTNDEKKYKAEILSIDSASDIAILKISEPVSVPKIEAENLKEIKLGNSDKLKLGQTVIAIGNALGEFRNTVTTGVISGIGRTIIAGDKWGRAEKLENVIQTDAAINPGNSGGPLLNLNGEVIGINTAISQEGQLIGFAIPINIAKSAIESVKKHGKIIRPFLGIRYILVTPQIAKQNNLEIDYGALIIRGQEDEPAVIPGSAADKAGLKENDIILEFNGQKIDKEHSLADLILKHEVDQEIELKVLTKGKKKTIKVKLGEVKD